MTYYSEDAHDNTSNQPTRQQWERMTIRQRHELLQQDTGPRFKQIKPGKWVYLMYPETGIAVRFQVDRRRRIIATEVMAIERGNRLADAEMGKSMTPAMRAVLN